MEVLHFSDRQDERLRSLFLECDVMFTTGDLTIFDLRPIEDIISTKPCFGVYGNHDNPGYLEKLGITNVHLNVVKHKNFKIGGYQGSPRYKPGGGPQFTEEEAKEDLESFPGVDMLLLHAPPHGMLDDPSDSVHAGSRAVREYVVRTKPDYIFCGHAGPSAKKVHEGVKIFRTHKARLIEL